MFVKSERDALLTFGQLIQVDLGVGALPPLGKIPRPF